MEDTEEAAIRVVPWDREGDYGIHIDYGRGSWRSYLVGSFDEARREQARLTAKSGVRRAYRLFR